LSRLRAGSSPAAGHADGANVGWWPSPFVPMVEAEMMPVPPRRDQAAPELMDLKLRQIAYSDMLILNKIDLVAREEIWRIKDWLGEHFCRYRLAEATRGNVTLEILLAEGRFDPARR
jgi:G3E family GTPase